MCPRVLEGGFGIVALNTVDQVEAHVLINNVTDPLSTNPENVMSERACLTQVEMTEWGSVVICGAYFSLSP